MKKFILLIITLIMTNCQVLADSRYFTVRNGISTINGVIPVTYGAYTDCDVFSMSFERAKYYLIKDNGTKYNRYSLLGCDGSQKESIFTPLLAINTDSNQNQISPEELRNANIRFVRVKMTGKLDVYNKNNDFDINRISYIDIKRRRYSTSLYPSASFDIYTRTSRGNLRSIMGKINAVSHYRADRLFE